MIESNFDTLNMLKKKKILILEVLQKLKEKILEVAKVRFGRLSILFKKESDTNFPRWSWKKRLSHI